MSAETTQRVHDLPWYRIVKLTDRLIFGSFRLTSIFNIGQIGKARCTVKRTTQEVNACIEKIIDRELKALGISSKQGSTDSITLAHVYDMIGKLDPTSTDYREGLADTLCKEQAFTAATRIYTVFCEANPDRKDVKIRAIQAMIGAKDFEGALTEIHEAKISLFPPEQVKNKPARATLDMLKADCLIELKHYDEARRTLLDLLQADYTSIEGIDDVKRKLFLVGLGEDLRKFESEPRDDAGLFAKAKKMYGSLSTYTQGSVWTKDCYLSDFEFLVYAACSKKVTANNELHGMIKARIQEFLRLNIVSPKALLHSFLTRMIAVEKEAQGFLERYHKFAQATQENIPEVAQPIIDARKDAIRDAFFGSDRMNGSSGLASNLETFQAMLGYFRESRQFEDDESTQVMQRITDLLVQTNNSIITCRDSLVATVRGGRHAYINAINMGAFVPQLENGQ